MKQTQDQLDLYELYTNQGDNGTAIRFNDDYISPGWGWEAGVSANAGGTGTAGFYISPLGSNAFFIDSFRNTHIDGCVYYVGGQSGGCNSDSRLKKDVRPFTLGLDKLLQLKPIYFTYNGLGGTDFDKGERIGFSAQDVEQVAPELVGTEKVKLHEGDKDTTEILTVNYNAFTYMLINSVKELSEQNTKLKEENEEIKAYLCLKDKSAPFCN